MSSRLMVKERELAESTEGNMRLIKHLSNKQLKKIDTLPQVRYYCIKYF